MKILLLRLRLTRLKVSIHIELILEKKNGTNIGLNVTQYFLAAKPRSIEVK